ncbi:hypothetical protein HK098_004363 [Nowakowskiella sp. JEL0407]|nr:hypothetical protein HK098_004363 [Nowakowskiella sp. JEL0407]
MSVAKLSAVEEQTFSLEGKSLKLNNADDVAEYVKQISEFTNLTHFKLNGNTIGVEASKELANALKPHKNIQVVDLSDAYTGRLREELPLSLEFFVDALLDKESLIELNLSDNAFGPAGAFPLIKLLTTNRHLQVLKLNNNGLGPEGGSAIAKALAGISESDSSTPASTSVSRLHTLIMGRNRLENKAGTEFSKTLAHLPNLTRLGLPQNGIRPEGIHAIVTALPSCPKLEFLDLQDNTFTDSGAKAFAAGLAKKAWKNIQHINVSDCLLGAEGSVEVLRAIIDSKTDTITTLMLAFDELNVNAARLIPDVIRLNKGLERLELNGNEFNPNGEETKQIRDALREIGQPDALDELDEMDYEDEEEEEGEEAEGEEEEEKDDDVDALAAAVGGMKV